MNSAPPESILCQRIIAVRPEISDTTAGIDFLDLTWRQMQMRALAGVTRGGQAIRIILPADQCLEHGCVLAEAAGRQIVTNLLLTDVLAIRPDSPLALAKAAYALGNLHLPIQIVDNEILINATSAAEAALVHMGISFFHETRRFRPDTHGIPVFTVRPDTAALTL